MRLYPIINRSPNPLKPPARPPSRAQIHRAAFPHLSQIQFQLPLTGLHKQPFFFNLRFFREESNVRERAVFAQADFAA